MNTLPETFYLRDPVTVARELLGTYLTRSVPGSVLTGKIVETEAYCQDDPASHSYAGLTKRSSVMFETGGISYVYFIYGMYDCFNVVTGEKGDGGAVLIRALEPVSGVRRMWENRFPHRPFDEKKITDLCSGPGKLCRAMNIKTEIDNGKSLITSDIKVRTRSGKKEFSITAGKRIGIKKAVDKPWRFYIEDNMFISKK